MAEAQSCSRIRWLVALAVLSLPLLGWVILAPGLGGGFLFDDQPNLVDDPDWKLEHLSWSALTQLFGTGIASNFGRPLALLSFALNHVFTGMDPVPLKATGLAIHLFNGCLVLLLVRRLIVIATSWGDKVALGAAWVLAFAWMVHPIQVSSALYIIQRMEVGAASGILLSLLSYLRARSAMREGALAWPWWASFVISAMVGFGFKETALLIPGYTLMLELFLLRFSAASVLQRRVLIIVYSIGSLLCAVTFFGWVLPTALAPATYSARDFTLPERLYSQLSVLLLYLRQMVLPWPESLWFYYDNYPISKGLLHPATTLLDALLLLSFAMFGWLVRCRWPMTALGIGWFFTSHALTSNVMPLELVFEHRNYLALLAVLLALVQPFHALLARFTREARVVMLALPLAYIAGMGFMQAVNWSTPLGLALTLTTRNPDSARAGYEYGRTLIGLADNDRSSPAWGLAIKEFEHAASLPNSSPLPDQALIILGGQAGGETSDDVWRRFSKKLLRRAAGPQELSALEGVLECRVAGHCKFGNEQSLFTLMAQMSQRNPNSSRLRAMYANYAFNVIGDRRLAMRMIREAVAIDPSDAVYQSGLVRIGLASNLLSFDEAEGALAELRKASTRGGYEEDIAQLQQWLYAKQPN